MTVYLLLLSLLKNICGQVRQLQLGFDAESPRSDLTHERSSQGIDRVEFWGQNDSARHPSKLARTRCPQNSRVVNELLRVICVYTFLVWVLPRNHHCTCQVSSSFEVCKYVFFCRQSIGRRRRRRRRRKKTRRKCLLYYKDIGVRVLSGQ